MLIVILLQTELYEKKESTNRNRNGIYRKTKITSKRLVVFDCYMQNFCGIYIYI